MAPAKTIKRRELYKLVRQQPMAKLAKTFFISDVGLAKICRKHDIPRPPRGYWAKKQFGQDPPQVKLPKPQQDNEIEIRDGEAVVQKQDLRDELQQIVAAEKSKESPIEVPDTLRGAHALVRQTHQELEGARTDEDGYFIRPEKLALDITSSKAALRRSLLIMDALLKTLDQRGYAVEAGPTVTIMEVDIHFSIREQLELKREPADDHKLEGRYVFGFNRSKEKRTPSGRLTLTINEGGSYWLEGCRYTWRDTEKKKLEVRLNQFVAGLVDMAAKLRQHNEKVKRQKEQRHQEELRREEQLRQLAEQRKLFKAEKARVEQLLKQANDWRNSRLIREMVTAVREANAAPGLVPPEDNIDQWIEWATQQADRLDPLLPSPPSILDENIPEEEPSQRRW